MLRDRDCDGRSGFWLNKARISALSQPVAVKAEGVAAPAPRHALLYGSTIAASAFLLFQVQPLIAKLILPWFGGSAAVWTTCMLFFQVALLGGYLYAHWTTRLLSPPRQALVHTVLLAVSLLLLPITPGESWKPPSGEDPTLRILGLLAATVGLPYFLLSTTGPLVQAWYSRVNHGRLPYRLFALSNFASMAALLSYPVVVEPFLRTRHQSLIWSAAYVLFAVLAAAAAMQSRAAPPQPVSEDAASEAADAAPGMADYALWVALPACASLLLLSVTNFLTQDVASIPFLWILPLSLYLLSFVLCFDAIGWYRRIPFLILLAAALAGMVYRLRSDEFLSELPQTIALYCAGFFVCCMVCHGELAALKPHPRHLTAFYLMISVGGALGGVFVGVIAPAAFAGNYELPIGIALCVLLAAAALYYSPSSPMRSGRSMLAWCVVAAFAAGICGYCINIVREWGVGSRVVARNFYGGLRVSDEGDPSETGSSRKLRHGEINHGEQYLHPSRKLEPTTYYCPGSGVGMAIEALRPRGPLRIGVIGLGAGGLAAYGRDGDYFRFYEINPLILKLATTEFTYTRETPARVEYVMGDARLSLEREPSQQFDLLVVDAFSGDSIPIHLLTREAFGQYFRHLRDNGILAVHISNRHLDLAPVVKQAALAYRKQAREIDTDDDDETGCFGCTWVLLASRFDHSGINAYPTLDETRDLPIWTDDYSNLLHILK